eukprot:scaffold77505_cov69-Phaeocystis_antarctica.AAC.1
MPRAERRRSATRGVWGSGRSPCPCHRRRRASSAHSRTHSHMLIGTYETAQYPQLRRQVAMNCGVLHLRI